MRSFYLALVASTLAGCANQYTLDGKQYSGEASFLEASRSLASDSVNSIEPLGKTLTSKKLIFAMPNEDVQRQNFTLQVEKNQPNGLQPGQDKLIANLVRNDRNMVEAFGRGIRRRNIYTSVTDVVMSSPTAAPEATPGTDVLFVSAIDGKPAQWYYVSHKSGRQIFAFDRSVSGQKEYTRSMVEAVQAHALRD